MKRASTQLLLATILILVLYSFTSSTGPSSSHPDRSSGTLYEGPDVILQEGNSLPKIQLIPKPSRELADNRIGAVFSNILPREDGSYQDFFIVDNLGIKRVSFTFGDNESPIDYSQNEFFIPPAFDDHINEALVQNDIMITYVLSFFDKANHPQGWEGITSRFKTEEEILRYLDYVRFIVGHFKDRVQYYKIWVEPGNCGDPAQCVRAADMINLIRRVVPVIKEVDPEAKAVLPSNVIFFARNYFNYMIKSDIMPLIDVVEWQTLPDEIAEEQWEMWRDFYTNYPSFVQSIKDTASAHGFSGEYRAAELWWWFPEHPTVTTLAYPESAIMEVKNRTRGILNQLGLGVNVSGLGGSWEPLIVFPGMTNFFTVMAGAAVDSLPVAIEGVAADIKDIKQYGFTVQNGSDMVILWRDVEPVANDPGVPVTITLAGFAGQQATSVDVLHGVEQPLITSDVDGNLVIDGLLVKDYPVIVRFSSTKIDTVTQDISLNAGWSLISARVQPANVEITGLFSGITGLQIVKDNAGNFFVPDIIDLIKTFDPSQGYWVFTDAEDTLAITGDLISQATLVTVSQGWNLIPYYVNHAIEAPFALISIVSNMAILQGDAGRFFVPDLINTLGNMQPGKGYNLFMNASGYLGYGNVSKTAGSSELAAGATRTTAREIIHFQFSANTGGSYSIVISEALLAGTALEAGDEIGVFDGALTVGAVEVTGSWPLGLAAWVDNSQTGETDGYTAGDTMSFKYWDKSAGVEFSPTATYAQGDGTFGSGAFAQLSLASVITGIEDDNPNRIPDKFALEQNYPNPFNPVTEIKYQLPKATKVTLAVYDILGKEIVKLVDGGVEAGFHSVTWDASNVASGVYIYRIIAGNFVQTRRMVLLK